MSNETDGLSEEQRLLRAKAVADANRMRNMVKEVVYPFLLEKSTSVIDAKNICQDLATGIRSGVLMDALKRKMSEAEVDKYIAKDADFDRYREMVMLFKDESIVDALRMLEGMPGAIDSFIREEMYGRPLKDLKTDFLNETPV